MRRLLWIAIIVVILLAVLLGVTILNGVSPNSFTTAPYGYGQLLNSSTITLAYIALSIVTYLLAIILMISTIIRLIRLLKKVLFGNQTRDQRGQHNTAAEQQPERSIFGDSVIVRVVALGVATVLFSNVVGAILSGSALFFIEVARDTPGILSQQWNVIQVACSDDLLRQQIVATCINEFGLGFIRAWISSLWDAYDASSFRFFPFTGLVFFALTWAISGQILNLLTGENAGEQGKPSLRNRLLETFNQRMRGNLLFFIIVIIGGYFSLVAVISIPLLQQAVPDLPEVSTDRLREQITEIQTQHTLSGLYNAQNVDPFAALSTYLEEQFALVSDDSAVAPSTPEGIGSSSPEATAEAPALAAPQSQQDLEKVLRLNQLSSAEVLLTSFKSQRHELLSSYETLQARTTGSIQDAGDTTLDTYEANTINRLGVRENVSFYLTSLDWYRNRVTSFEIPLISCAEALRESDQAWEEWSKAAIDELMARGSLNPSDGFLVELVRDRIRDSESRCDLSRLLARQTDSSQLLTRPELGAFSGAFGLIAQWLLETESLELALIVGLVGFGVLGAAVSRFVREQRQRRESHLLVEDLTGVMLRGVVAAVLVFLTTKSGLGIYDTGGNGAQISNPYLVLLLCLVAGVYSEVVWAWAQQFIDKQFPGEGANEAGLALLTLEDELNNQTSDQETVEEDATVDPNAATALESAQTEEAKDQSDVSQESAEELGNADQSSQSENVDTENKS